MLTAHDTAIGCVDLATRFGARFRVRPEADGVTWFETPVDERPWLLELVCRYGVVYPHGGLILAAACSSPRIGSRVARLPGILASRGHLERVVRFHVADAEPVFALLRPYRAYELTPARQIVLERAREASPLCKPALKPVAAPGEPEAKGGSLG